MARGTLSHARVACEGPRPTVKGDVPVPVARGPVPRDRCMARDRPSPYDEGGIFAALLHRDQEVSPTGKTELFGVSRNPFDNNEI